MKCPGCGADVTGKNVCSQCGRKCTVPLKEIEVEYKNFALSEFLEIRPKGAGSPQKHETVCSRREGVLQGEQEPVYAPKEQAGRRSMISTAVIRKSPSPQSVPRRKPSLIPLVLAVLLLLAIVIGAWYLWRFLTIS